MVFLFSHGFHAFPVGKPTKVASKIPIPSLDVSSSDFRQSHRATAADCFGTTATHGGAPAETHTWWKNPRKLMGKWENP